MQSDLSGKWVLKMAELGAREGGMDSLEWSDGLNQKHIPVHVHGIGTHVCVCVCL